MVNPFRADGEWFKAQFHSHSSKSDGVLPPESVTAEYLHRGYDVLTISDHWTLTRVEAPDELLILPGAELGVDPVAGPMAPEFLAIGIDEVPEEPNGDPANWHQSGNSGFKTFATFEDGAAFVEEQSGVSVLCHPAYSGLPQEAVFAARVLDGIEVWNAGVQRETDRGDSSYMWDLTLDAGISLAPFASDDSHDPVDIDDAWTMVRAADRTREAVIEALTAGRVYATNGPRVHDVQRDGGQVEVAFDPARDVWLHSAWEEGFGLSAGPRGPVEGGGEILERDDRGLITRARFTLSSDEQTDQEDHRWWRLVIADDRGRRAWTNVI